MTCRRLEEPGGGPRGAESAGGDMGRDRGDILRRERTVPGTEAKACPWRKDGSSRECVLCKQVWEAGPQGTRLRARHRQAVNGS